ncbi:MAG: DUF1616 domain-containing protein [Archaeoglobaceae archaeon]|nr:DUF1616 domain-containing protein [Archaeoglobaceae archaeon]MDW8117378.1 DUF1616 domain-containing protein [Archaeoglobaceae archaeon]
MKDWDLIAVIVLSLLIIFFIYALPESPIRVAIGLIFILFLPGYSLISFLFPEKDLENVERFALSFALSIAVVPIIGLILNYTPFGIKLSPILLSISAFNIIFALMAILRRRKSLEPFRPKIKVELNKMNKLDKIITIILLTALIISISVLIYIIMNPKQAESFTEFYLLGPKGKAVDYPTSIFAKQQASLIIGLVNHEQKTVNYTIEIWLVNATFEDNKTTIRKILFLDRINVQLEHKPITDKWETQWEILYNFSIDEPGSYKMFFLLFKDIKMSMPSEEEKMKDFTGTEAENRIKDAIDGKIQSLILNIVVKEI